MLTLDFSNSGSTNSSVRFREQNLVQLSVDKPNQVPVDSRATTFKSKSPDPTKAWRIAKLRQKLPEQLPLTTFSDLKGILRQKNLGHLEADLQEAHRFAEAAHSGTLRQDGTPYIHHPARVCAILLQQAEVKDIDVLRAALLHDVVEDTEVSLPDIRKKFGEKTSVYVDYLTKPSKDGFASKESRNAFQAKRLAKAPREVKLVKIADRLDNISDLHMPHNKNKMGRYLADTRNNYLQLASQAGPTLNGALQTRLFQLESLAELAA